MRRCGLRANASAVVTLLLALTAACTPGSGVDQLSYVVVNGIHYSGGPANGYRIDASQISRLGTADEIRAAVRGRDVYRLSGVDPGRVVVMRSANASESPYWILFRVGVLPESASPSFDWSFPTVPGLCRYLVSPPPSCS